jgi:tetratricopeptide (TPR) repeat protein
MKSLPTKRIAILLLVLIGLTGCNLLVGRYHFLEGERLYNANKFYEAIKAFDGAITNGYKPHESYAYRGLAHFHLGQYDLAIADNNAALAITPDYAPAYNGRGLAYYRKGEIDKTIADMERVLKYSDEPELREAAIKLLQALKARNGANTP